VVAGGADLIEVSEAGGLLSEGGREGGVSVGAWSCRWGGGWEVEGEVGRSGGRGTADPHLSLVQIIKIIFRNKNNICQ
jgi:hypothetical protein